METKDFYLTAFLFCKYPLVGNKKDGNQTTFEFPETEEVRQDVREYYSNKSLINPQAYGNAVRNLKTLIHMQHPS